MEKKVSLKQREIGKTVKYKAREPSERQKLALLNVGANGGKKAKAIRDAGYSESMARNPSKVFNSPAIMAMAESIGIKPSTVMQTIKRHMNARKSCHMVFPAYNPEKARKWAEEMKESKEDNTEKIYKSQLTDADIADFMEGSNCRIYKIQHSDTARHVYFWADDAKAQLTSAELFVDIFGLKAPKEVAAKIEHEYKFSLSQLRRRIEKDGVEIITPFNEQIQP